MSQTLEEKLFPSVDPFVDTRSVQSYVSILNPYRATSEQQVEALQEEKRTTLEQVKALKKIIASEMTR